MHWTIIAFIFVGIVALSAFVLVLRCILPGVARESHLTAPACAWVDLWIPLLAAIPFAATIALARIPIRGEPFAIWWAVVPMVMVCSAGIGLMLMSTNHPCWPDVAAFRWRHGLALSLIGLILWLVSYTDRLHLRHAFVLFVVAIIWMWVNSPSGEVSGSSSNRTAQKGKMVLDWSGRLAHPIPWKYKLATFGLLIIWACLARFVLQWELIGLVCIAVVYQALLAIAVGVVLGRACAIRSLLSTIVFSTLLSIGGLAFTRLQTNLYLPFLPESFDSFGPTVILGTSSLRAAAILMIGLGTVSLLHVAESDSEEGDINPESNTGSSVFAADIWSFCTGLLILFAAVVVAIAG